jgi:hypothetical protein
MAVIQISKMQVRRGQTSNTGFPQLSSGELGWSIDKQELYIGNGAVAEGAPAVGNTRVLTEHDNFFLIANSGYIYENPLYDLTSTVQTGPDAQNPVVRGLQSKLDDHVNLRDFVTTTDINNNDYTVAAQRAINHASSIRKKLEWPEGTYPVNATLYIPPFTTINGAGENKTFITNKSISTIFQNVDGLGNLFPSLTSGANSPQNIEVIGITFVSTLTNASSMMRLDCVTNSIVSRCKFLGNASTSTQANAIDIRGQTVLKSDNIVIENNVFEYLATGIASNYDTQNIIIQKNNFNHLNQGVGLLTTVTTSTQCGPINVLITQNNFTQISRQGIYVGTTSTTSTQLMNIVSRYNYFKNVGNGGTSISPETNQITEVIAFNSMGNSSEGDYFSRLEDINTGSVAAYTSVKPIVKGAVKMVFNNPTVISLNGTGNILSLVYPLTDYQFKDAGQASQAIEVAYTIVKTTDGVVRRGTLEIMVVDGVATVTEQFTYSGANDGYVTFTVSVDVGANTIKLFSNNQATLGNLTFTYTVRQV